MLNVIKKYDKVTQLKIIMMATIKPYKPIASAKIIIKIIPTKIPSVWAYALTPASPATPIASPAAKALKPQASPAPRYLKASFPPVPDSPYLILPLIITATITP